MTSFTIENAIAVIGLLGLGGIIATFLQSLLEKKNKVQQGKQEYKQTRYLAMIMLMHSSLDFEKEIKNLRQHGRNFNSLDELKDELIVEWHDMYVYAPNDVIKTTHDLILNPSDSSFRNAILAMRKDLCVGVSLVPKLVTLSSDLLNNYDQSN